MSEHLTGPQLQQLRAALEEERAQLLGRTSVEVEDDGDDDPTDLQDRAAEEVLNRDRIAISDHDQHRLAAVESALARIAEGVYGECEETGESIPFARLVAQPTTRYTVEALEILEDERRRAARIGDDTDTDVY